MDPILDEQEEQLRAHAAAAADEALAQIAAQVDDDVAASRAGLAALGAAGLLGVAAPTEHGGGDEGLMGLALCVEEIGRNSASVAAVAVNHAAVISMIAAAADAAQQAAWLPALVAGERLAALAVDETRSILHDPATVATLADAEDEATVSGVVAGVVGATIADVFLVPARRADGSGVDLLVVEATDEGVSVGDETAKLGLNGSGAASVTLENVVVPAARRLDGGDSTLAAGLDVARLGLAAACVGVAQAALLAATERATQDPELADEQAVQWKLADTATETEAARLSTWYAATRDGAELTEAAAMARLLAAEAAVQGARRTLQVCGAGGSSRAAGIERLSRDAQALEVHQGSSEAQRLAVARRLLPDLVDG